MGSNPTTVIMFGCNEERPENIFLLQDTLFTLSSKHKLTDKTDLKTGFHSVDVSEN